jgi:c-di-AMP phosphodiesterase-like protein
MFMKYLLPILFAFSLFSCQRHSDNWEKICDIEKYIESRPDSALTVLEAIGVETLSSDEERAKYSLYMSMALDKNYIDKTDFEVLQPAIDYYEKHGSATDKLRTFYYQGRIFYNKGETEETMECLVISIHLGKDSEDILVKARNYYLQITLYIQYYIWQRYMLWIRTTR